MASTCIIVIICFASLSSMIRADCVGYFTTPGVIDISVMEGTLAGSIMDFGFDVEIVPNPQAANAQKLFNISGSHLNLTDDLILDGDDNKDRCKIVQGDLSFDIECKDVPNSPQKPVVVQVTLTDDYAPKFTREAFTAHVPEENTYPFRVIQFKNGINVYDEDCQENTHVFDYNIENQGQGNFAALSNGTILMNFTSDYEENNIYKLNISVLSRKITSREGKKGFTNLTVLVDDIDDRDPVFNAPTFELSVDEEKDLSKEWLQTTPAIKATDGDTGIDQPIVYSIAHSTPVLDITIDSSSGGIKINSILDRENVSSYLVVVKATQTDKSYKSSLAALTIHVKDVNDHRPSFSSRNVTIDLPTTAYNGTWVVALNIVDPDEGDNAKNTLSIASDDSSAFGLSQPHNDGTTWLVIKDSNALQGKSEANIVIQATPLSAGTLPCDHVSTCVTKVKVNLFDTNESTPKFRQDLYSFEVLQFSIGGSIGNASLDSNTVDASTRVAFSMVLKSGGNACQESFGVNGTTGEIIMKKELDEWQLCLFQVEVCVNQPANKNRLCSRVPVSINVVSMASNYDVILQEDVAIGTNVFLLPNRHLELQDEDFEIRSNHIVTKMELDREKKEKYDLNITDKNDGLVSTIHVKVKDVNDNPPIANRSMYTIYLTGLEKRGKELITVEAHDVDDGPNGDLSFFLIDGSTWLSIGEKTGIVTLNQMPSLQDSGSILEYFVNIQDNGSPPFKTPVKLQIHMPPDTNTSTPLVLGIPRDTVIKDLKEITNKLSSIIGHTVQIVRVEPLADVNELGSNIFLTAQDTNGKEIPSDELKRLLKQHAQEIFNNFKEEKATEDDDDHLFKTLFIVAVVLCGVLLLSTLIMCRYYRTRNKIKTQQLSIMSTLNKDTKIYDDTGKDDQFSLPKNGGSSVGRSNGISHNGPTTTSYDFDNAAFIGDDYENVGSSSDIYAKIFRNGSTKSPSQSGDGTLDSARDSTSANNDSTQMGNWSLKPITPEECRREYDIQQDETHPKPYISTITIVRPQKTSSETHYKNIPVDTNTANELEVSNQNGSSINDVEITGEAPREHDNSAVSLIENETGELQTDTHPDYSASLEADKSHDSNGNIVIVGLQGKGRMKDHDGFDPTAFLFLETEGTAL